MKYDEKSFPGRLKPMSPSTIGNPFSSRDFIYEIKWDGFRAMANVYKGEVKILSRRGFSLNKRFPSLADCFSSRSKNMILDGEIVVTDEKGRADFEALRYYTQAYSRRLCFYIFDILYYDKYSLLNTPLVERKKLLKRILPKETSLRYVDYIEEEGINFFHLAEKNKLEGIIAKRKDSYYYPGLRTKDWLKIKTNYFRDYLKLNPREF